MHEQLRRDLTAAIKRRDSVAVPALRSLLSALANAEAVHPDEASFRPPQGSEHVAGASVGVGSAEVERRTLSPGDRDDIVATEVAERRQAATVMEGAGRPDAASRLLAEAEVLAAYLGIDRSPDD